MDFSQTDLIAWVGGAAALCSTISFAPQAWKIIVTRDTGGLSAPMYSLTVAAFALWLAYGAMKSDWALIATNLACFLLSLFILVMLMLPRKKMLHVADRVEDVVGGQS